MGSMFLWYMQLQGLKTIILSTEATVELDQLLDEKSMCMIMYDATDDWRETLKIIWTHYKWSGRPQIHYILIYVS